MEHPERRYLRGTRPFWPAAASAATLGDMPSLPRLEAETGARRVSIAQCACGGRFQKLSVLLCSPRMAERLEWLGRLRCARCDAFESHEERAVGSFADGSSKAEAAGAYSSALCRALAEVGLACPLVPRRGGEGEGGADTLGRQQRRRVRVRGTTMTRRTVCRDYVNTMG